MANPISRTAYYTLGVRAWDASLSKPVCGDAYAKLFMNADAQSVWEQFKDQLRPNSSNAARHKIIDQQLQKALDTAPHSLVMIIGAGFDSRAFRLKGGRWIEVDEDQIITVKESILPSASAPNQMTRLTIDFSKETLLDKLSPFRTADPVHIIVEGVLMYLPETARQTLIKSLQSLFPRHTVYCDLMSRAFFEKFSKPVHEKIKGLGATFTEIQERPQDLFLNNNYELVSCTSIALYAAKHGSMDVPAFIVKYFMRLLREGYAIWTFKYPAM